jgi:hypothetical protein
MNFGTVLYFSLKMSLSKGRRYSVLTCFMAPSQWKMNTNLKKEMKSGLVSFLRNSVRRAGALERKSDSFLIPSFS